MTVRQIISSAISRLNKAGVPDAEFDAKELACFVLGIEKNELFLKYFDEMPKDKESDLEKLFQMREKRIPLQRIMGKTWFMGLEMLVFDDVLIPRSDTEILAEAAIEAIESRGYKNALDLCCGSGAIGIAVKKLSGIENMSLSDISDKCILAASKNAQHNETHVNVVKSDMLEAFLGQKFDIIACNPPYIDPSELESLQEEVRLHDPHSALFAEHDGYFFYEYLARHAEAFINKGGMLLMEVGISQADRVAQLFKCKETSKIKDLNGVDRVVKVMF